MLLARTTRDPDGYAPRIERLGDDEGADHQAHEVGGHHHRVAEPNPDATVGERRTLDLGTVRQRQEPVGHHEGDAEDGLEVRFVPAREAHPSVGGFEMGGGDDPLVPAVVEGRPVEPGQPVVQRCGEPEPEGPANPVRPAPRGSTVTRSVAGVDRDLVDRDAPVGTGELHAGDLELLRVQDDLTDRLVDRDGDTRPRPVNVPASRSGSIVRS